ncbi:AbrB/MazE/SpoVT family DNA-binding domain-containing protein [Hydrocarboniclastica marina]|uniref:AbrB/MazE/SpoVT family DNA-binding domain-containing protein n=1 Tax=Hydrocarboniclastica marina TaxID=2259620 RepID=UPI003CCC668E
MSARTHHIRGQNENHHSKIRKNVGVVPPAAICDQLHLKVGDSVEIDAQDSTITIQPYKRRRKYALSELLAQCDEDSPFPDDLTEWDRAPAVGREQP